MSEPHAMATGSGPLDTLRQVKEAEEQFQARLAKLRADGQERLRRLREDAEAAVVAARADSQRAREELLARTRAHADEEAATLLAEGRRAAQAVEVGASQPVAARRDPVLDVVLGEFRRTASDED